MTRYYFHLVDGTDTLLDPEGVEISDGKIAASALAQARAIIAADAADGQIDLRYRIEVRNEAEEVIHCLPFDQAVAIHRSATP